MTWSKDRPPANTFAWWTPPDPGYMRGTKLGVTDALGNVQWLAVWSERDKRAWPIQTWIEPTPKDGMWAVAELAAPPKMEG